MVEEVLSLILEAKTRAGKQQMLSQMQESRGLDARGQGLPSVVSISSFSSKSIPEASCCRSCCQKMKGLP